MLDFLWDNFYVELHKYFDVPDILSEHFHVDMNQTFDVLLYLSLFELVKVKLPIKKGATPWFFNRNCGVLQSRFKIMFKLVKPVYVALIDGIMHFFQA